MNRYFKLALAVIACEAIGLAATPVTMAAIPTWYATLQKPWFNPPNWIFGPVWTLLYALMGIAAFLIWEKGPKKAKVRSALFFFGLQLILNFFWSIFFFGLQSPELALIEILALWVLILVCVVKFYKIEKAAAYLMLPYLLWVTFASVLNFSIVLLN